MKRIDTWAARIIIGYVTLALLTIGWLSAYSLGFDVGRDQFVPRLIPIAEITQAIVWQDDCGQDRGVVFRGTL